MAALCVLAGCAAVFPAQVPLLISPPDEHGAVHGAHRAAADTRVLPRLGTAGGRPSWPGHAKFLERHLGWIETIAPAPLVAGNDARLLVDGPATFGAMLEAIERARRSIALQTYILEADELGERVGALLVKKRAQGVAVSILYDSVGSLATPKEYFAALRRAGIAICESNPVNPLKGRGATLNQRDHRKILVVDDEVAFTGGINISRVYASGSGSRGKADTVADQESRKQSGWRDTQIAIRGPAVAQFQGLFAQSWVKQRCPGAAPRQATRIPSRGAQYVRVVGSSPDDEVNFIYAALNSALRHAETSVSITMAYFVPDAQTIEALTTAARRGVTVRLVLPGFSDFSVVFHAGRSFYQTLLDAGVQIYERRDALLHAKTVVVDDVWSMVGSANIDWRSFVHNDEVTAIVLGSSFAELMTRQFERDLASAARIDPRAWRARGLGLRAQEAFARLWQYWL